MSICGAGKGRHDRRVDAIIAEIRAGYGGGFTHDRDRRRRASERC